MPRYYFDVQEDTDRITDKVGSDLSSLQATQVEAANTVAEMARDHIATAADRQHYISITVRDDRGTALLKMDLAFESKVLV